MVADQKLLGDVLTSGLPAQFKRIGLAISGGADSVALLKISAFLAQKPNSSFEFVVLSVDHQLRNTSAGDADFVEQLSLSLGLEVHILKWEGDKPDSGIQDAARLARYHLMVDKCRELGLDGLVTAHTLEDQAETLLMRLKRGSGLDGLSSMAAISDFDGFPLLRPFLGVHRQTLRDFLKATDQAWVEDPSNQNADFERVRIRKDMASLENMGFEPQHLAQTARRLWRSRMVIDAQVHKMLPGTLTWFDTGCCQFSNSDFNALEEEIALRILSHALRAVGGGGRAPQLQKVERAFQAWRDHMPGAGFTLAGCRLIIKKDKTLIVREERLKGAQEDPQHLLVRLGDKRLWDRRFMCEVSARHNESNQNSIAKYHIRALGAQGWEFLKQNSQVEEKMPSYLLYSLVSLWCGDEIVSVPHLDFRDENVRFDVQFLPTGLHEFPEIRPYG